jgi:hypothetical protein
MSTRIDEIAVREFIEIINAHVKHVVNGADPTGVLQLCRINPADDKSVVPTRFQIDDTERMVQTAIGDAAAGHNVYIEPRTVRADLRGNKRGSLEDTAWVWGLVADSDADKGKGGHITARPSLVVETSPGNFHLWYLFTRAVGANKARVIGDAIRANSGTDQDTGVITQCYRVAGTPNFPSAAKRARGRLSIEPTKLCEHTGRLWDPDELQAAFTASMTSQQSGGPNSGGSDGDEATLPDDLLQLIRQGGGKDDDRSVLFHGVIGQLKRRHWTVDRIVALLEKYPDGIAKKYAGRLRQEVERSYNKVDNAVPAPTGPVSRAGTGAGSGTGAAPGTGAPHISPTIRLIGGQLIKAIDETERALIASNAPVFTRAGMLVEPVTEPFKAADGRKTLAACLHELCVDSLFEPVAEAALFQRYDGRRKCWVDIDPPPELLRKLLVRRRRWTLPHIGGVITCPTLRADGSLLATPGYDPQSELYLEPGITLPPIPERPTREQAQAALASLIDLLKEFSFKDRKLDRAVALAGLLTAHVRGMLATAPVCLIRADTPGTGKSYLVDVIATIATGRDCPVITASKNAEETDKKLGSILLSGVPIVSLDNCMHDLEGELLCQVTERPLIKIRILGRSETPDCESRTTLFVTGNNVVFKGDMVRRNLICNLEALSERPELREFDRDTLKHAADNRAAYVAAVLTIIRAYFVAGVPRVCGPLGSYSAWSAMVRSPLVWLGEPDPIASTEEARSEDPELSAIRELFDLWVDYGLALDEPYTTARILEIACAPPASNDFNPRPFEQLLQRVASEKGGGISALRLGWWLRKISGRVVAGYRLIRSRHRSVAAFELKKA